MSLEKREFECADLLLAFLDNAGLSPSYLPGDDPPDFVFQVSDEAWAVEHTRLMQRIQGDSKPISRQQCTVEDFSCRKRIIAQLGDELIGTWWLCLEGPFKHSEHVAIEKAVCVAIRASNPSVLMGELEKEIPRKPHERYFGDCIELTRCSDFGSDLACGSSHRIGATVPNSRTMASDIYATNTEAVDYILQKKSESLIEMKSHVGFDSIVLLLDSQLPFGTPDRIATLLHERFEYLRAVDRLFILYNGAISEIRLGG